MLISTKFFKISKDFDIFFSFRSSLLFIKGTLGVFVIRLPSYYFYLYKPNYLSLLFLSKFFLNSILSSFFYLYNRLFIFHFAKLKIKGLGYRVKKIAPSLFRFFFGTTNFLYFHLPKNFLMKFKKRKILLVSNSLFLLRTILAQLLLLKKLNVYQVRGLMYPRQILTLKVSKRTI